MDRPGRDVEHIAVSPAKVNLLLKVLSRRPDGYHNLLSIVDLVSLYDVIHIREEKEGRVTVEDSRGLLPDGPENTVYRAVMLLKERFGVKQGVRVYIEKNIPIGAGLGGGSSNAATVLKELARIWRLPLDQAELMGMGATIGADVPLFIHGKSCVIRGIGERITPVTLPLLWYMIVYPQVVLHTKDVYGGLKIVLTRKENDVNMSTKFVAARDIVQILENDLEEVAFRICPAIKRIKERLNEAGALGSLMSGSGSSVFGVFADEGGAQEAAQKVRELGSVFIAHSV